MGTTLFTKLEVISKWQSDQKQISHKNRSKESLNLDYVYSKSYEKWMSVLIKRRARKWVANHPILNYVCQSVNLILRILPDTITQTQISKSFLSMLNKLIKVHSMHMTDCNRLLTSLFFLHSVFYSSVFWWIRGYFDFYLNWEIVSMLTLRLNLL